MNESSDQESEDDQVIDPGSNFQQKYVMQAIGTSM